jgi:hypothetical protein
MMINQVRSAVNIPPRKSLAGLRYNPPMSSEDVRREIEKEVKRRLEEHFDQLKEEFEKMRLESHRKWEEFLMRLDFPLPELVPPGIVPEPEPVPAPAAGSESAIADLREFARSIDSASSQVDALKAFLSACVQRCDRAVLLVSRGDSLAVWKSEGFSPEEESSLRSVSVSPSAHPALQTVMGGEPVTLPAGSPVSALLSGGEPGEAVLVPIVVREKISALLYADRVRPESAFDPDALALFSYLIGIAVDRLGTRKIVPAPALVPIQHWGGVETAPPIAPSRSLATESARSIALEPPSPPPPRPIAVPSEPPPPPPAPSAPPPSRGVDLEGTGKAYRPPSGIAPGGAGILRSPDEDDPHENAKKIARLLVSDIRLYNEAAIEEGKKNNDIYARLKDDIDRARQTYEERVPESVRRSTNYFFDELIRSLADGSPQAFGS